LVSVWKKNVVSSVGRLFGIRHWHSIIPRSPGLCGGSDSVRSASNISVPEFAGSIARIDFSPTGDLYVAYNADKSYVKKLPAGSTEWIDLTHDLDLGGTLKNIDADAAGNVYAINDVTVKKLSAGATGWTDIPSNIAFANLMGIAADQDGSVYVSDSDLKRVYKLSEGSSTWTEYGPVMSGPIDLRFGPDGSLYVMDRSFGCIMIPQYQMCTLTIRLYQIYASGTQTIGNYTNVNDVNPNQISFDIDLQGNVYAKFGNTGNVLFTVSATGLFMPFPGQVWASNMGKITVGPDKLTGLTPLTTYYVRSYATNIVGTSFGEVKTFTTTDVPPVPAPDAPANLTATAGDSQVILSWSASAGAENYSIYQGYDSGAYDNTPIATDAKRMKSNLHRRKRRKQSNNWPRQVRSRRRTSFRMRRTKSPNGLSSCPKNRPNNWLTEKSGWRFIRST